MRTIKLDTSAGDHIEKVLSVAIARAIDTEAEVFFDFNGAEVHVRSDSSPELILRDFYRYMEGCLKGQVGPYPPLELSIEALGNDARIRSENEARHQERKREYENEMSLRKSAVSHEIEGHTFQVVNAESWRQAKARNGDSYGGAVMIYAEQWARLMQARMASGNELEAIAKQASHDADTEGITGFMYGAAVHVLSSHWRHGERLRRWHNLDTQVGSEGVRANEEGGTLNPAMLRIG